MMKKILTIIVTTSIFFLCSFNSYLEPTKKETFDFIINQCGYFSKGPSQKYSTKIDGYNYENLTIDLTQSYSGYDVKAKINLNDINNLSWSDEHRSKLDEINDETANAMGLPPRTSDIYIYFRVPYKTVQNFTEFPSINGTQTSIVFSFSSKIEAKKMHKALLHMQTLVGVKKDLFDDK